MGQLIYPILILFWFLDPQLMGFDWPNKNWKMSKANQDYQNLYENLV